MSHFEKNIDKWKHCREATEMANEPNTHLNDYKRTYLTNFCHVVYSLFLTMDVKPIPPTMSPIVRYLHFYAGTFYFCKGGCRMLRWVHMCGRRKKSLKKNWGENSIFIPQSFGLSINLKKREEMDTTIEGNLWRDRELLLASEGNLKHKKGYPLPFLIWCPALFVCWFVLSSGNLGLFMVGSGKRYGQVGVKAGLKHMVILLKPWQFLWESPDRTKGNLRMRNKVPRHHRWKLSSQ